MTDETTPAEEPMKVEEETPNDAGDETKENNMKEDSKDTGNGGDDDDNDDDDDDSSTFSEDSDAPPPKDPELLLMKASTLKEEGNALFQAKDYEKAARSYRRGTNALKPLNKKNTGDPQVKTLLVSLQTNLSLMCAKQGKHKQSAQVATQVLGIDPLNVKALYRRAIAKRALGDTDEAKQDLKQALQVDPSNASVQKEFASLKRSLAQAKQAQQKGLQKAFSKNFSLYDDETRKQKQKEEEEKQAKIQAEERQKKRKKEWEDEMVKRMSTGEVVMTFEDWGKEQEKKQKEEEKRRQEERRKARAAAKAQADSDSEDDELTEQELAQLRGYKKTKDGRITSYFTREQSTEEKSLIGDIAPKRLGASATSSTTATPPAATTPQQAGGKGNPSAWNQAGTTWEEKNTSDWCRDQLTMRLVETKGEFREAVAVVTKVDNLTGDASVAIASGKKRYIFDFHCKVNFEVRDPETDEVMAKSSLSLPDICSTHHDEVEVQTKAWSKKPSSSHETLAQECQLGLVTQIRESVRLFVEDFNNMY